MDAHALHVLEFEKVITLLMEFAVSSLGQSRIREMEPMLVAQTIRDALGEVEECMRLYYAHQAPPLDGIHDVAPMLKRGSVPGAMLEADELLRIGETIRAARRVKGALKSAMEPIPQLKRYGDRLAVHPDIEREIDHVFDPHGEVHDRASNALSRIRKSIRQLRSTIVSRLEKMIRGKYSDSLQETFYTQRDGRFVLPVDSRYQSKVPGIVHDRSSTHTTVYIEPMDIVEDGNRLLDLHRDERAEVRKILQHLTAQIAMVVDELYQNLEILGHVDFVSAKARFSIQHSFQIPTVKDKGAMLITDGRHPLLVAQMGRENVVPLDLCLEPETRGLIITGPNTGGKTVVLKTVGLLQLMMQSGVPIPVAADSELPVYQSIGADIGDEQSLEQSLSTFSSHMKNICELMQMARPGALVLMDELGSGTDPVEGGALACSILQELADSGAQFMVTTHLQDVKLFAHRTDAVENGAMEFDMRNLNPTFRFIMGLPGQSNAIQIAGRLGVPASVIERARASLDARSDSAEDLLHQLGVEVQTARDARRDAEQQRTNAIDSTREAQRRIDNARKEANQILNRAERKGQYLIQELERRLRDLEKEEKRFQKEWKKRLDDLLKQAQAQSPPDSKLKDIRRGLEDAKRSMSGKKHTVEEPQYKRKPWRWDELKPGVRVRLAGLSEMGKVIRTRPDRKEAEVQVSSMSLRVKENQILQVLGTMKTPEEIHQPAVQIERPDGDPQRSVDIHGMTVDEMLPIVQQFIDRAYRSELSTVTIVHGHGTGTLRREVRRFLSTLPIVQRFQNGQDYEGGGGVTVVQLTSR